MPRTSADLWLEVSLWLILALLSTAFSAFAFVASVSIWQDVVTFSRPDRPVPPHLEHHPEGSPTSTSITKGQRIFFNVIAALIMFAVGIGVIVVTAAISLRIYSQLSEYYAEIALTSVLPAVPVVSEEHEVEVERSDESASLDDSSDGDL